MSASAAISTAIPDTVGGLEGRRRAIPAVRRADPPRLERRQSRQARRRQCAARPARRRGNRRGDEEPAALARNAREMNALEANAPDRPELASTAHAPPSARDKSADPSPSRRDPPGHRLPAELHLAVVHRDDARGLRRSGRRPAQAQGRRCPGRGDDREDPPHPRPHRPLRIGRHPRRRTGRADRGPA